MRDKDFNLLQEAYFNIILKESNQAEIDRVYELLRKRPSGEHDIKIIHGIQEFLKKDNALGAPKFASFFYNADTTGSKMKYLVHFGVNYENIKSQSKEKLTAFADNLPEGDPRKLAAASAYTRNITNFFKVNLGEGIAVGMKWPDLKKYVDSIPQDVKPVNLGGMPKENRKKWFEKNPSFNSDEFINSHPELLRIYIAGTVKKVSDVVQNRQTPISQGEISQMHRDAGTRQSEYKTFILDPKNIAGIKIEKGTIMLQDSQFGTPYVETTDMEESEEHEHGDEQDVTPV
jgi:mannose/fructose/N-acetylgalactosamine-specific phosphotransferase system component IIB